MPTINRLIILLIGLSPTLAYAEQITLIVNGDIEAWEYKTVSDIPETSYQSVTDGERQVLRADTNGGASGYVLKRDINLQSTPWVHFLWRVDTADDNPHEKTKAGDDFALRLYFITQSGVRHRTLNLVYAQHAAAGDTWESPYSNWLSDVRLYAFATKGDSPNGEWRVSSVNVGELWQNLFDTDDTIKAVGLMTDGDNTNSQTVARYGDVVLSDSAKSPFDL